MCGITTQDILETPFDPGQRERGRKSKKAFIESERVQKVTAEEQSKTTSEAGRKERERRLRALGRSGTVITGGRGLTEPATVKRKTLLGQ